MKRATVKVGLALVLGLGAGPVVLPAVAHGETARAVAPARTIEVSGKGVSLSPAFDPAITRYAVRSKGAVKVAATTRAAGGTVLVNGSPSTGTTRLTGLTTGDEISVIFDDGRTPSAYALVVVPPTYPRFSAAVDTSSAEVGPTLLTTGNLITAVDRHGAPLVAEDVGRPVADFKARDGQYSFAAFNSGTVGAEGDWDIVRLDETFSEVDRLRIDDDGTMPNTDSHDAILRPDGSGVLIGYEPDDDTGLTEAVIQEVDADGDVVFTWDSADHPELAAETTAGSSPDYVHINSIEFMDDGDILASFRHLSAALKIAWPGRTAEDDHEPGDIVWRFGGRRSDFEFLDDPHGGPCAQHTVRPLADGHILVFDNGSAALGENPSYCVDPSDREGPTINRAITRVTEYALESQPDGGTPGQARLVWSYSDPSRFSYFAGSAQRLGDGDTLIGWASSPGGVATQVDAAGTVVWDLVDLDRDPEDFSTLSYRADWGDVPDAIAPVVEVRLPRGGRYDVGDKVSPRVTCTDRGGSTLQSCRAKGLRTGKPGSRTMRVIAVDGAGNRTVAKRDYTVAETRPTLRARADGEWLRRAEIRTPRRGSTAKVTVRATNVSSRARRLVLAGPARTAAHEWSYRVAGRNVSAAVRGGTWRSPKLAPGDSVTMKVVVRRTAADAPAESRGVVRSWAVGEDRVGRLRIRVLR
ncbi:aryl-sulfate sulfotransferase [Nocardioides sp. YIM 152588]|uniref:aryl-sulfate sulfotransferase n=1 Tax=Nocardioides sp. YIM 152588 TaxID=3158259 RepID=UPI0032E39A7D